MSQKKATEFKRGRLESSEGRHRALKHSPVRIVWRTKSTPDLTGDEGSLLSSQPWRVSRKSLTGSISSLEGREGSRSRSPSFYSGGLTPHAAFHEPLRRTTSVPYFRPVVKSDISCDPNFNVKELPSVKNLREMFKENAAKKGTSKELTTTPPNSPTIKHFVGTKSFEGNVPSNKMEQVGNKETDSSHVETEYNIDKIGSPSIKNFLETFKEDLDSVSNGDITNTESYNPGDVIVKNENENNLKKSENSLSTTVSVKSLLSQWEKSISISKNVEPVNHPYKKLQTNQNVDNDCLNENIQEIIQDKKNENILSTENNLQTEISHNLLINEESGTVSKKEHDVKKVNDTTNKNPSSFKGASKGEDEEEEITNAQKENNIKEENTLSQSMKIEPRLTVRQLLKRFEIIPRSKSAPPLENNENMKTIDEKRTNNKPEDAAEKTRRSKSVNNLHGQETNLTVNKKNKSIESSNDEDATVLSKERKINVKNLLAKFERKTSFDDYPLENKLPSPNSKDAYGIIKSPDVNLNKDGYGFIKCQDVNLKKDGYGIIKNSDVNLKKDGCGAMKSSDVNLNKDDYEIMKIPKINKDVSKNKCENDLFVKENNVSDSPIQTPSHEIYPQDNIEVQKANVGNCDIISVKVSRLKDKFDSPNKSIDEDSYSSTNINKTIRKEVMSNLIHQFENKTDQPLDKPESFDQTLHPVNECAKVKIKDLVGKLENSFDDKLTDGSSSDLDLQNSADFKDVPHKGGNNQSKNIEPSFSDEKNNGTAISGVNHESTPTIVVNETSVSFPQDKKLTEIKEMEENRGKTKSLKPNENSTVDVKTRVKLDNLKIANTNKNSTFERKYSLPIISRKRPMQQKKSLQDNTQISAFFNAKSGKAEDIIRNAYETKKQTPLKSKSFDNPESSDETPAQKNKLIPNRNIKRKGSEPKVPKNCRKLHPDEIRFFSDRSNMPKKSSALQRNNSDVLNGQQVFRLGRNHNHKFKAHDGNNSDQEEILRDCNTSNLNNFAIISPKKITSSDSSDTEPEIDIQLSTKIQIECNELLPVEAEEIKVKDEKPKDEGTEKQLLVQNKNGTKERNNSEKYKKSRKYKSSRRTKSLNNKTEKIVIESLQVNENASVDKGKKQKKDEMHLLNQEKEFNTGKPSSENLKCLRKEKSSINENKTKSFSNNVQTTNSELISINNKSNKQEKITENYGKPEANSNTNEKQNKNHKERAKTKLSTPDHLSEIVNEGYTVSEKVETKEKSKENKLVFENDVAKKLNMQDIHSSEIEMKDRQKKTNYTKQTTSFEREKTPEIESDLKTTSFENEKTPEIESDFKTKSFESEETPEIKGYFKTTSFESKNPPEIESYFKKSQKICDNKEQEKCKTKKTVNLENVNMLPNISKEKENEKLHIKKQNLISLKNVENSCPLQTNESKNLLVHSINVNIFQNLNDEVVVKFVIMISFTSFIIYVITKFNNFGLF